MQNYEDMPDGELILLTRQGDARAQYRLMVKYKSLVKQKARSYFIPGADSEDIIQEGMIGLYKAVQDFDVSMNTPFAAFAGLCVKRQILTAIKGAARKKHMPLNSSVSLNSAGTQDGGEIELLDAISHFRTQNPEDLLIDKENKSFIESRIEESLSMMECRVLQLFLKGHSYSQIAGIMKRDEKSIDNSLQRVRKKIDKILTLK